MAGLRAPLPTLRRRPRGRRRTARGRCGSLLLHRSGLAPPTPCRSPGALAARDHRRSGSRTEGLSGSHSGSLPLLVIGLASPYPGREPTLPLVAGPGFGPARHLGDRARPTRHHPDPPTPIAHGTLPPV